jgi:cell division transport system ATP-binding protein
MIFFDKVTKKYSDDSFGLNEVTLSIQPGEFVSIVGHSGAGKTTLLKMLLIEDRPTSGNVFFESVDIHNLRSREITMYRRRIGTVFQDFRLLPDRTTYENIAFAMEVIGRPDSEIENDVPHVLDLVDLSTKAWHFPHELSGGERQRVAIARAIINQPDLLIADEPTGNLDPVNTYEIVQVLKRINDMGTTVLLTTHNKGVIDSLERRVITMKQGTIIGDDPKGKTTMM